jgi:hypothetical protein
MKNTLAILGLFLNLFSLFSQENEVPDPIVYSNASHTVVDGFAIGDTTWVFGDKINVRAAANKDAAVAAQLFIGDEVIIRDTMAFLTMNGMNQRWYKVAYAKNGAKQEGYVWGGLLAHGAVKMADVSIVYGLAGTKAKKEEEGEFVNYIVEFRACSGGKIRSTAQYELGLSDYYGSQYGQMPNLGLTQYRGGIKVGMGFGACGYANYDLYVFWDGNGLVPLPALTSVADAGAFYDVESYIFPYQQPEYTQEAQVILFKAEQMVTLEDENETDEWTKVRKLIWDGKKYKKPKVD